MALHIDEEISMCICVEKNDLIRKHISMVQSGDLSLDLGGRRIRDIYVSDLQEDSAPSFNALFSYAGNHPELVDGFVYRPAPAAGAGYKSFIVHQTWNLASCALGYSSDRPPPPIQMCHIATCALINVLWQLAWRIDPAECRRRFSQDVFTIVFYVACLDDPVEEREDNIDEVLAAYARLKVGLRQMILRAAWWHKLARTWKNFVESVRY
jgi:hypothetical protein